MELERFSLVFFNTTQVPHFRWCIIHRYSQHRCNLLVAVWSRGGDIKEHQTAACIGLRMYYMFTMQNSHRVTLLRIKGIRLHMVAVCHLINSASIRSVCTYHGNMTCMFSIWGLLVRESVTCSQCIDSHCPLLHFARKYVYMYAGRHLRWSWVVLTHQRYTTMYGYLHGWHVRNSWFQMV